MHEMPSFHVFVGKRRKSTDNQTHVSLRPTDLHEQPLLQRLGGVDPLRAGVGARVLDQGAAELHQLLERRHDPVAVQEVLAGFHVHKRWRKEPTELLKFKFTCTRTRINTNAYAHTHTHHYSILQNQLLNFTHKT